jgi:hypothetical protein
VAWNLGSTPDPTWAAAPADAPPSDTAGLLPALGYLPATNGDLAGDPGTTTTFSLGVENMTAVSQDIDWTVTVPPGSPLQVSASTGTVSVAGGAKAAQVMTLAVAPDTAAGTYPVTITLQTPTGTALPDVVTEVDVS